MISNIELHGAHHCSTTFHCSQPGHSQSNMPAAASTAATTESPDARRITEAAVQCLSSYLDTPKELHPRTQCPHCQASSVAYCPECVQLLVDPPPTTLADLDLPFGVTFILDDRRNTATGVGAAALLSASPSYHKPVHVYDRERDEIPESFDENEGTYLLFPGPHSVPLSSIVNNLQTLVLLDCKWRKTSVRLEPSIASLPQVHLDAPPSQSFYWRWHLSGKGRVSTVEALYYAACQVDPSSMERHVHLLWLFALQRQSISKWYAREEQKERVLPFTEDGKEYQRSLRLRR